jgi:flagellar FliJ protein
MSGNKFRFSLQSVLDLREYETNKARYFLAQAVSDRQAQEVKVQRTEERLRELNKKAPAAGDVDLQTLRQYDAFRQHARHLRDKARERLDELCQHEDAARANWVEHRQAQESLETLHDGEKDQHEKEAAEAEMAFLDEQAVMRYCRNDNKTSLL